MADVKKQQHPKADFSMGAGAWKPADFQVRFSSISCAWGILC
jgi:hypothetical protein